MPPDPTMTRKAVSPRALLVTLLAWLAMLGAVLGNVGAFSPSANNLAASPLQWQRFAGTTNVPRASRRESPRAVAMQHTVRADWSAGGSGATVLHAHSWAPLDPGRGSVSAVAPSEPPPAPRRRAHLGRAPPTSA